MNFIVDDVLRAIAAERPELENWRAGQKTKHMSWQTAESSKHCDGSVSTLTHATSRLHARHLASKNAT